MRKPRNLHQLLVVLFVFVFFILYAPSICSDYYADIDIRVDDSGVVSKTNEEFQMHYKKGDMYNAEKAMDYLISSSAYSNGILKNIDNATNDKGKISIDNFYNAGAAVTKENKCPFCHLDLNQYFFIPDGKCPNCKKHIWYG